MRNLIVAALLCLAALPCWERKAFAQTYHPTPKALIAAATTANGPLHGFEIYLTLDRFPEVSGKKYEVWFYFSWHNQNKNLWLYDFYVLVEIAAQGYAQVTTGRIPTFNPVTGAVQTSTFQTPFSARNDVDTLRRFYTYAQVRDWYFKYNESLLKSPRNLGMFVAKYGDPGPVTTLTNNIAFRNLGEFYADGDGGGVPNYAELMLGPYPGTDPMNPLDDVKCHCKPCCSCRCTCGYWHPLECGGTKNDCACHDTGCDCGNDPDDPDPQDPPVVLPLSANVPPLLRALLFLLCMACGVCFYGTFMDSFEKGSF